MVWEKALRGQKYESDSRKKDLGIWKGAEISAGSGGKGNGYPKDKDRRAARQLGFYKDLVRNPNRERLAAPEDRWVYPLDGEADYWKERYEKAQEYYFGYGKIRKQWEESMQKNVGQEVKKKVAVKGKGMQWSSPTLATTQPGLGWEILEEEI